MRNAKIVCTLGPASDDEVTIRALAAAGMSVARINTSHGSPEDHAAVARQVRTVDEAIEEPLATMIDLQGLEVRTAAIDKPIDLPDGASVRLYEGEGATVEAVGLSHGLDGVSVGDRVLIDDGRVETTVTAVDPDGVHVRVEDGGEVGSRKGVNVPGVDLGLDVVTERDRRAIETAAEVGADFVAASFVRDADDVYRVGEAIEDAGGDVPVIAKVERAGAVENLDGIVEAAYGIMVARGDLGVECPLEDVPVIQKDLIRRCHRAGVPVVTATEMLDSMVHERRPTRAEASDVANAVLDGTDAVMLSGETAVGDHPVRVVEAMDRIVRRVEDSDEYRERREERVPEAGEARAEALARSARYLARDVDASAVVAVTESGYTALKTAKFRPGVETVAATPVDDVRRRLAISWGIRSRRTDLGDDAAAVVENAVDAALSAGAATGGDAVVVLAGMLDEGPDVANTLKVHVATETLARGRGAVAGRATGAVFEAADGDLTDAPDDAIVALPGSFAGEFVGDTSRIAGIVAEEPGLTGYAAIVARELKVPMISGVAIDAADGTTVTVDGDRGVVYEGTVDPLGN
ncbi:pyruvate kinase [Halobacteriales archaeon SW_7_68_16]|nr:MAG: pyruvate kinase [Halobacteriales archaeon SW_7_68_16]